MAVGRPVLRYHGGKWMLAPWIVSYFPEHRVYVEPFGGAASVLLRKQRSYAEVYNDLDGEIVNLFRVLRNPSQARELVRQVKLTPYAREEFELSYISDGDPVEQARRTLFRAAAGFATGAQIQYGTGFRTGINRTGSTPADDWVSMPDVLDEIIERLRGVVVEHRPAADVIRQYDTPNTMFYCDPPYVYQTRSSRNAGCTYKYEMTDDEHRQLAEVLHNCKGMVVLSGYPSELYGELYGDWTTVTRATFADGASTRTEQLWFSPTATRQPTLFTL
jgi:DNA adenine methylase